MLSGETAPRAMPTIRHARPLPVPDTAALRHLPEGPCALRSGLVSWICIEHGAGAGIGSLNRYDLESRRNESFALPGRPGFAFPCATAGHFVVGCERSLGIFDLGSGSWSPFCDGIDDDVDGTIINDGLVYEDNLIFGCKDLEFRTRKAGLYLWRGRDRRLIRLRNDQVCSNGKAIRKVAGRLELLDIDSPTRQVVACDLDLDAGMLGAPRVVLDLTADPAVPDGATLTPDGSGLIVSMFLPDAAASGETRLYDLDSGELLVTWLTAGSPQNTCPALVPHDGRTALIITTAVENMSDDIRRRCPDAGRLFVGETDFVVDPARLLPTFPM
ncbi:MAG: SMP-30/gluconolactonase/LRE family protein [Planctomycetes bacterium]|nr:SMP-30/gluconolactonase/LRE family protein [Planctomycetota bacterium]